MRITTVINQKGGVGKTTTAHALVTGLNKRDHKVLAVDVDPQGNLSYTMGANTNGPALYELMRGDAQSVDIIQNSDQGDILPSTLLLTAADMEFTATGREWILDGLLKPIKHTYDHIIIDSPPTLGILTINALTASSDVVIPMGADIFSLQGLYQLHSTILKVRQFCNKDIKIAGLLLTRYNTRSILSRDIRENIKEKATELQAPLYNTVIREGVAVKEAQTTQKSLFDYAPKSNPAKDYENFVIEYLQQERKEFIENA
jgi:chromosome partitioning protein